MSHTLLLMLQLLLLLLLVHPQTFLCHSYGLWSHHPTSSHVSATTAHGLLLLLHSKQLPVLGCLLSRHIIRTHVGLCHIVCSHSRVHPGLCLVLHTEGECLTLR